MAGQQKAERLGDCVNGWLGWVCCCWGVCGHCTACWHPLFPPQACCTCCKCCLDKIGMSRTLGCAGWSSGKGNPAGHKVKLPAALVRAGNSSGRRVTGLHKALPIQGFLRPPVGSLRRRRQRQRGRRQRALAQMLVMLSIPPQLCNHSCHCTRWITLVCRFDQVSSVQAVVWRSKVFFPTSTPLAIPWLSQRQTQIFALLPRLPVRTMSVRNTLFCLAVVLCAAR